MSSAHDAFLRTASALATTYRAHAALLDTAPSQFLNLLLDECGSDHRPLVDLLLSTGALVRPRLQRQDVRAPWDTRRAPLVHQLVATRYLQPDVARWLVDAWGAALDVAPTQIVQPALAMASDGASTANASAASHAPSIGGAATAPPPRTAPYARPVPLPPPAPKRSKFGARATPSAPFATLNTPHPAMAHPAMARAVRPRWRTLSPAMNAAQLAQLRRLERWSLGAIAFAAVGVFVAAYFALSGRKTDSVAATAGLPVVSAGSTADSIGVAAVGPMQPIPATAGAPTTAAEIAALTPTVSAPLDGPHLISRGVGGRYRVRQHGVQVTGSPSCSRVADALAKGRTTVEVITHTPGTFSFTLASRDVVGSLTPDAFFDAGPMTGTTDGVTWQFRMSGRFTPDGFIAETHTTTAAILRWARTQECAIVAELIGERLAE